MKVARVLFLLLFLHNLIGIKSQDIPVAVKDSLIKQQLQQINGIVASRLYNPESYVVGKLYFPRGTKDNHPFFPDYNWNQGYVEDLDGIRFNISMMKYDMESDALVMLKIIENQGYAIELDKNVIHKFTIAGHHFEYWDNGALKGYYEVLYNSKTKVWAKRTIWKKIDANARFKGPQFITNLHFIVLKEMVYTKATNLYDVFSIYADHKQELKKFRKQNKLSFANDEINTMIRLSEQYDKLTIK